MKSIELLVYAVLGLSLAAFAVQAWRNKQRGAHRQKGPVLSPRPSGAKPAPGLDAQALLQRVQDLRDRQSGWSNILVVLNPTQDQRLHAKLIAIRGPHMFDPRTGLGVIEAGCRAVAPNASALTALQAAEDSMRKVLGAGQ